jgi:hypothetical protein
MPFRAAILALAVAVPGPGWTDVYRVRNNRDSGAGSLRWAIEQANTHVGRDKILFAPTMAGEIIKPATPLPNITDAQTVIIGDIDDDGQPDVAINGKNQPEGDGLRIQASRCVVAGLAITNFPNAGIRVVSADHCTIRSCHLGVNLAGTNAVPNDTEDIVLHGCDYTTIGGNVPEHRNLFGCRLVGVAILDSSYNVVSGNYFGLASDGVTPLDPYATGHGIAAGMVPGTCTGNVIGGTSAAERNVFGGLTDAIALSRADDSLVVGNYVGLGADGDTLVPIEFECIRLYGGAHNNTVGGTTAGARNVIAGGAFNGVMITDAGTRDNKVQGSYLGMNAAGTARRALETGVNVRSSAGANLIGGSSAAGNYFGLKGGPRNVGVWLSQAGGGSRISNNQFGLLPDGSTPGIEYGVYIEQVSSQVRSNTFMRAGTGVLVKDPGAFPAIIDNSFRRCETAVHLRCDGRANLGNLSNSATNDDGGNVFRSTGLWHIYNDTANLTKAEGNDFGSTFRSDINAKLYDRRDNPFRGKVDFVPLMGGVIPTGDARPLTIATPAAVPTRAGGAEIAFSLSAPANLTVSVLNIAGRPTATVMRDTSAGAGLQRVVWNGLADSGARVPNGAYLVRVVARDDDGQQAQSLCALRLGR